MPLVALLCALLIVTCLPPSVAQASTEESAASIGRLNHAGFKHRRHCTAFLVAPSIALTAAHCLEGLEADEMHLLLGYDRGRWREHLRTRAFWYSPDGKDLAAVCLKGAARAAPLSLETGEIAPEDELTILGYGLPSVHLLSRRDCRVSAVTGRGGVLLNCPVTKGTSGGPVLSPAGDAVVAVVSASNREESLAVALPAIDLAALCP